jgi:1,4-dihydroxy-2-naphthoate octaprenyltransferase
MKKSTLLHLRVPFSFFLLPVYLFALAVAPSVEPVYATLTFIILHLLVYPASNGYNSYFDKDEGSIGGLRKPPAVSMELYNVSISLDVAGIVLGFLISVEFAAMVFIYGMISKAYSHPAVRLKKMPFVGWAAAGIFQGYFTFLMSYIAIADVSLIDSFSWEVQFPAVLTTMLLFGSYPMTQVYQHDEDTKRGDITISIKLGVLGTFHFTAASFAVSMAGFVWYFISFYEVQTAIIFLVVLSPVLGFFGYWYLRVRKDRKYADFDHTMRLNFLSSLLFNLFFVYLWLA